MYAKVYAARFHLCIRAACLRVELWLLALRRKINAVVTSTRASKRKRTLDVTDRKESAVLTKTSDFEPMIKISEGGVFSLGKVSYFTGYSFNIYVLEIFH